MIHIIFQEKLVQEREKNLQNYFIWLCAYNMNVYIYMNMYILLIVLFYNVLYWDFIHTISLTYFSETKYAITITIIRYKRLYLRNIKVDNKMIVQDVDVHVSISCEESSSIDLTKNEIQHFSYKR